MTTLQAPAFDAPDADDPTFDELGVSPDLVAALAAGGITNPLPVQTGTIPAALAGRDTCGKAATGSGKTLAFGLPLLQGVARGKPGLPRGLVLVPTRELAVQVHAVLEPLARRRNVRIKAVYGGTPIDRQIKALRRGVDVVIATPGRFIDLGERGEVSVADVHIVVLDEADRMVDMGFLPQVQWVLRRLGPKRQTLLFSATLDRDVEHLVRTHADDPVRFEVPSPRPTVETMQHRFFMVHQKDKPDVAVSVARGVGRTLLFVRTKRGADRLVQVLRQKNVAAGVLHGGLSQGARQRELTRFRAGKVKLLVATDVAARGLDIDDIDVVVHYDPPEDHKAYLHRSGRTARAGDTGIAVSLVLWDQVAESETLRRRLRIGQPLVELFSNDPRLGDLSAPEWAIAEAEAEAATGTEGPSVPVRPLPRRPSVRRPGGRRRRQL